MIVIFISIGPIIDEVQDYKYMNNRQCAKARQLLLIIWLFVAFNLTLCYKEVLIANLVDVGYEDTIDDLDDVVNSGLPLLACDNCMLKKLILKDPRIQDKNLMDKLVFPKTEFPPPTSYIDG